MEREGIEHGFTWWGLIVVAVTFAGFWIRQTVKWVFGVNERLEDHDHRLGSVEPQVKGQGDHLARLDVSFARLDEKLDAIKEGQDRILERMK